MKKKKLKDQEFVVEYVYSPSPDAEERVNRAFDILFREVDLHQIKKDNNS